VAEAAAQKKSAEAAHKAELERSEVDFPEVLSDADHRTTALVAVKDKKGQLVAPSAPVASGPPPALDQIPVVPLPAGTLLAATSVTEQPKDDLSRLAVDASKISEAAPLAEPGVDGGFLVQVASFKDQKDADDFVKELRARGHEAFRQAANVPGRGIWHRVRIGSFKTKYQAELYKEKFEKTERTIALVIDPEAVERQQKVRAAKLAERIRKFGAE
jgi:cell division septation protein DedD